MYILSAICEKKIQNIDTYRKIDLNILLKFVINKLSVIKICN